MFSPALEIVKELICVSEKSADIARECRLCKDLFSFLVQRKTEQEGANASRFSVDFKTVADVFIQRVITNDLGDKYPILLEPVRQRASQSGAGLDDRIRGEEGNVFKVPIVIANGDSKRRTKRLVLDVKSSKGETTNVLCELLMGLSGANCSVEYGKEGSVSSKALIASIRKVSIALAEIAHRPLDLYKRKLHLDEKSLEANEYWKGLLKKHQRAEEESKRGEGFSLLEIDDIGIWVDPIDGTNEYIKEGEVDCDKKSVNGIHDGGLPVVTVLIGVFSLSNGKALMGVVNCPFSVKIMRELPATEADDDGDLAYTGECQWGVNLGDGALSASGVCTIDKGLENFFSSSFSDNKCVNSKTKSESIALLSKSETKEVIAHVKKQCKEVALTEKVNSDSDSSKSSCQVLHPSGAGYKLFCVASGRADVYVVTNGNNIFKWDTCGPHAIVKARGGNVVDAKGKEILYHVPDYTEEGILRHAGKKEEDEEESEHGGVSWANTKGIIAFNSKVGIDVALKCWPPSL